MTRIEMNAQRGVPMRLRRGATMSVKQRINALLKPMPRGWFGASSGMSTVVWYNRTEGHRFLSRFPSPHFEVESEVGSYL